MEPETRRGSFSPVNEPPSKLRKLGDYSSVPVGPIVSAETTASPWLPPEYSHEQVARSIEAVISTSLAQLLHCYEQKQFLLVQRTEDAALSEEPILKITKETLFKTIDQKMLYFGKDVLVFRWDEESASFDDPNSEPFNPLDTLTPYPRCEASHEIIHQLLEENDDGCCFAFLNLDHFLPDLRTFLQKLDIFWRGCGGCVPVVYLATPKSKIFPPHVGPHNDRIVIQLEGSQKMTLYEVPDPEVVEQYGSRISLITPDPIVFLSRSLFDNEETEMKDSEDAPDQSSTGLVSSSDSIATDHHQPVPMKKPERRRNLDLKAGDVLFLSSEIAFESENDSSTKDSLQLCFYLPKQLNWTQALNDILKSAQEIVQLNPNIQIFPHLRTTVSPSSTFSTDSSSAMAIGMSSSGALNSSINGVIQNSSNSLIASNESSGLINAPRKETDSKNEPNESISSSSSSTVALSKFKCVWKEGTVLEQRLRDMLNAAANSVSSSIASQFQQRCSFGRSHFHVPYQWFFDNPLQQEDIRSLLDKNGGLVKISNFLPEIVADRIFQTLDNIDPDEEWQVTEGNNEPEHNNIPHFFYSAKSFPNHHAIFQLLECLVPTMESSFSAGRYLQGHYIDPHDDRAYKDIADVPHSRSIAAILYLTKNWTKEDGGCLVDYGTQPETHYVPEYNSLVLFRVPRWHSVEPVQSDRPRLSLFGWFFEEGRLYDLNADEETFASDDE